MARPRDRPGGRAFRCTWDKNIYVGITAAVLFTTGLHCMHWHARVARSVVLPLTFLIMTTRTQTTLYVCVCCEQRGTFTSAFPTIRAARTHIGRSRAASRACAAAGLGIQEITLETRQTNTMVGGSCAAGPALVAAPTAGFYPFL